MAVAFLLRISYVVSTPSTY